MSEDTWFVLIVWGLLFLHFAFAVWAWVRILRVLFTEYRSWADPKKEQIDLKTKSDRLKVEILEAKLKDLQNREIRHNIRFRNAVSLEDL